MEGGGDTGYSRVIDQPVRAAIILALTLALLASRRMRADLVAVLALFAATVAGVVPPAEAFAGFASPVVAVAALVMVAGSAVRGSGVIDLALRRLGPLLRWPPARGPVVGLLAIVTAAGIGPASAFLGLLPGAVALSRRGGRATTHSAGPLLLALLFATALGGLAMVTATIPNLIVSATRAAATGRPLRVFALLPVGGILALIGLVGLVFLFFGARLARGGRLEVGGGQGLLNTVEGYTSELFVPAGSPLVGRTIYGLESEAGYGVRVTAVIREEHRRIAPRPDWPIEASDIVVLACEPETLQRLMEQFELRIVGHRRDFGGVRAAVVEAVITPASELVGQSPLASALEPRHHVSLLAIGRSGAQPTMRLARITLRAGDVLVLQGALDEMPGRLAALGCLPLAERRLRLGRQRQVLAPAALLAAGLLVAGFGTAALPVALLGAALAIVLSRAMSVEDVYTGVSWPVLVLVGALLPVVAAGQAAIAATGLAAALGAAASGVPAVLLVTGTLLASLLVAVAVGAIPAALVLAPLAADFARALEGGVNPLLVTVALGTSAALIPWREGRPALAEAGLRSRAVWRLAWPLALVLLLAGPPLILAFWPWRPA